MEKNVWVITIDGKQFTVDKNATTANVVVIKQIGGTFHVILGNHNIEDNIDGVANITMDPVFLKKLINGLSSTLKNYENIYGEVKITDAEGVLPLRSENKGSNWN